MSGNHASNGSPIDHHHHQHEPRRPSLHRRAFLGEVGKGTVALALFTPAILAACSRAVEPTATAGLRWGQVVLGNVSAYILVRGTTAAIVDTGVAGSAGAIGRVLVDFGLGYADVDHVFLTHHHSDHAGSIDEVLAMADSATAYAGEADLAKLQTDTISGLVGGEEIFGLEVLATPGHTAGHMAVIDHEAGLLVAGDALQTRDGMAIGPNERYTTDLGTAHASVAALAALSFNTLLVGHGSPLEGKASASVAQLAATLG